MRGGVRVGGDNAVRSGSLYARPNRSERRGRAWLSIEKQRGTALWGESDSRLLRGILRACFEKNALTCKRIGSRTSFLYRLVYRGGGVEAILNWRSFAILFTGEGKTRRLKQGTGGGEFPRLLLKGLKPVLSGESILTSA